MLSVTQIEVLPCKENGGGQCRGEKAAWFPCGRPSRPETVPADNDVTIVYESLRVRQPATGVSRMSLTTRAFRKIHGNVSQLSSHFFYFYFYCTYIEFIDRQPVNKNNYTNFNNPTSLSKLPIIKTKSYLILHNNITYYFGNCNNIQFASQP